MMRAAYLLSAAAMIAQPAFAASKDAEKTAASVEALMRPEEHVVLTEGVFSVTPLPGMTLLAQDAVNGAGYVLGIPRLGVPLLKETDASLGVSYVMGLRKDDGATPLPSGLAMRSTWNPALIRLGGKTIAPKPRQRVST